MADLKLNNVTTLTESGGGVAGTFSNVTASGNVTVAGDLVPATPLSNRNMIINGAMNVAQRGGISHATNGVYSAVDRFKIFLDSTEGRVLTTHDSESPAGFSNSLKVDCTTIVSSVDAGDLVTVAQVIEAQNLQHLDYGAATAKDMVLSFWIRSPKSGIHCVDMLQNDNSNKTIIREFTVASANTWEKFSVLIPGDTSGVINNDTGPGLTIHWTLVAGSDYTNHTLNAWTATSGGGEKTGSSNQQNLLDNTANNFYLTGVQLELGSNATPFESRSYGDELARCQRYHEIAGGDYSGRFYSTTACEGVASFQVTKRATPIISKYGNPILHEQAIGAKTFSAVSAGVLGSTFAFYECTGTSSATAGNICWGRNAHLIVDAEI